MELKDAILKRRSVRKFDEYTITDGEISEIMEAARWAPSWKNLQDWEFIVVKDREKINRIADTIRKGNPAVNCSRQSSVFIVACARPGLSGYIEGEKITKFNEWFMFDLGLAVQNMCLRIHDLGLGSVIIGTIGHDEVKKILNIPEGVEPIVGIAVGKPGHEPPPKPRKELNEFVHFDKF